jgi:hypothetical protein
MVAAPIPGGVDQPFGFELVYEAERMSAASFSYSLAAAGSQHDGCSSAATSRRTSRFESSTLTSSTAPATGVLCRPVSNLVYEAEDMRWVERLRERLAIWIAPWVVYEDVREFYESRADSNPCSRLVG